MFRSFTLGEQASRFSREGSFDSASLGPLTGELALLSHEEPRSEGSFNSASLGPLTGELALLSHEEPRSEGYDEYFDPPLESKYECPICLLGLRQPVQTSCGHRFCRGCIVRSIRDAGPKCPVDNEPLSEAQLHPDNFAKREMESHEVFCRMKKQRGCPWKGPLGKLEEHLDNCPFMDVNCPKECGQQLLRKALQEHLEKECPFRTIPCTYCTEDVAWNAVEMHYETCPKFPQQCKNCKKENIKRDEMKEHLDKECPVVKVVCPFSIVGCSFVGKRSEVNHHVNEQMASHVMDMAKKIGQIISESSGSRGEVHRGAPTGRTRGGMGSFPREQASQEAFFDDLSTRTQHQRNEIDEMQRTTTDLKSRVTHMERQLEEARIRQERPVQELTLRFNRYETKLLEYEGRVCNGSYIWRIENYRQCRQDAINGVMTAIHSPAFYTNLYGYKLCMRINLNGVDSGVGKHVALFVHMMQGDYDTILEWPFTGRIALSIMDQSDGAEYRHHISETLVAKPNLLAFQRPTAPRNYKGYGYVEFAPIEQIREPQYVKNNTMLVRIQIFH